MKNNKKHGSRSSIRTIIFSFCVLLSMAFAFVFPAVAADAASSPALSIATDSAGAVKGQAVDVKVNLSGNPAISTLGMVLNYDSSILQYAGSTWNSSFSGSDMTLVSDDGGSVNISAVCDNAYTADGVVVTVRFEAVSDSSEIPVSLGLRDMTDSDLAEVTDCRVSSGLIMPQPAPAEKAPEAEEVDVQVSPADSVSASQTPAKNTSSKTGTGPDENYKTGAGFGNDVYLLIAAFCGILALAFICKKERKHAN